MKKGIVILAFIAVGLSFTALEAQPGTVHTIPYTCGFDSAFAVDGWTTIDYNNDGHTWSISPFGTGNIPPHNSSAHFAGSSSFVGGANGDIAPDDFLVSPRIAVTGNAVLSWWFRIASAGYPADHYSVYISTGGSTAADFLATTPVYDYTPTSDDYGFWSPQTLDLSAYVGDTISIAFRHHNCFGQFAILIDEVEIAPSSLSWSMIDTIPWSTAFDTPDTGWTFIGRDNGWYIGAPGALNGSGGMYVSGDGGATNSYNRPAGWYSRFHWAVRPLHFTDSGDFRVDYDWKCDGYYQCYQNTCTYYDYVRVMLAPVNTELDTQNFCGYGITTYTNNLLPNGWINLSDTNGRRLLACEANWTHHAQGFHVPAAGDYLLLVLAVSSATGDIYHDTPPCLDNLSFNGITCHNSVDTLRLTANSNRGITVNWHDSQASQWAVYVNDSLYGITADTSFYLAGASWNAAACKDTLRPRIAVSPICAAGDTALPVYRQAVWKNDMAGTDARTVSCTPFMLPYGENFDMYQHDDRHCFGWTDLGEIVQYVENYQSHSGLLSLNMRAVNLPSGKSQLLASPRFDAPGNQLLVSFWAKLPAYSGAAADTLFQVGILFNHDTMDYAHVAANSTPMITLLGSDASNSWVRYQFTTAALTDSTPASITFSLVPHSSSWYNCYIDDIEVSFNAAGQDSVPPVVAVTGPFSANAVIDTARFAATLVQGDTAGLTYTWHSTLTGQSYSGGSQWSMVYSVVGVDTIQVIATNRYGADTAEHLITVSDNLLVSIRGSATAYVGDTLHYTAVVSGPDATALSYSWHSTMADAGLAQCSMLNSQFSICYSANGTDTLTLTVNNAHGPHIATRVVTVQSCGIIATFPYSEDFENYGWQNRSACWLTRTPTGLIDNEWRRSNAGNNNSPYCMYSNGNSTGRGYNAWLVSPAIELPNNSDSITFSFAHIIQYIDHFAVLASPTGDPWYDSFTDTLYLATSTGYIINWSTDSLSLDAYRGRHIRLAFVHYSANGSLGNVRIDDLSIVVNATTDTTDVDPPEPDTVWRTVTVTANVAGAYEPYGSGIYVDSSTVEIGYHTADTATVGGYWHFLGWNDGGACNPRNIIVTSDTSIVALFEWVADTTEGISDIPTSDIKVYSIGGRIVVEGADGEEVHIFDMMGRTIRGEALPTGVYMVRVGDCAARKVAVIR